MNRLRVALLYNLQHPAIADPDAPPDVLADQDRPETVQAVEEALRQAGHEPIALEADHSLLDTIRQVNPDICFNMARGREGQDRSSHVPALLEMLHIPYTGSGVMSQALALDKAAAKRIWADRGLPTAHFQVMHHAEEQLAPSMEEVPLVGKPLNESTSAGIDEDAVVGDEAQLRRQVAWVVDKYQQPALIERYLPGRYHHLPILELVGRPDGERVENGTGDTTIRKAKPSDTYICPASIPELSDTLQELSTAAFEAVNAVDMARVDFRCDAEGQPYLLEIDTLPSMEREHSRYVRMAEAGGVPFFDLVNTILGLAVNRYHLDISAPGLLDGKNQEEHRLEWSSAMSL
jgi:D-alanine-D-alanine ligase